MNTSGTLSILSNVVSKYLEKWFPEIFTANFIIYLLYLSPVKVSDVNIKIFLRDCMHSGGKNGLASKISLDIRHSLCTPSHSFLWKKKCLNINYKL